MSEYRVIEPPTSGEVEQLVFNALSRLTDRDLSEEQPGVVRLTAIPDRQSSPEEIEINFRIIKGITRFPSETKRTSLFRALGATLGEPSSKLSLNFGVDPEDPATVRIAD